MSDLFFDSRVNVFKKARKFSNENISEKIREIDSQVFCAHFRLTTQPKLAYSKIVITFMMQCVAHCDEFVGNRAVAEWIFAWRMRFSLTKKLNY
jgi:hypothetical protein